MNTALALTHSPVGDLKAYLRAIDTITLLSASEERALAMAFKKTGDRQAALRLVVSHLRFVVKIARQYRGYGLSEEDLIQQGNVGLMKAVKRYDPEAGVRLLSYAVHWIREEIHDFVLRNWRIVKITSSAAQRKLFFKLRSSKRRLGWLGEAESTQLAEQLGVTPDDVKQMEQRLYSRDLPFDTPQGDDEHTAPAHVLASGHDPDHHACELESREAQRAFLRTALSNLDQRSRDIITRRRLVDDKCGLKTLADEYGISAERVRQIENQALAKMRRLAAETF